MDSIPFSYHFCNAYTSYTESDILSVIWHMSRNVINVNKCAAKQKVRILGCRGVGGICVVMCRYMAHPHWFSWVTADRLK